MSRPDTSSLAYMTRRARTFRKLPHRQRRKHIRRERQRAYRNLVIWYELLVLMQGRFCQACGSTRELTLDHILPISRGGRTVYENLQVLCHSCNQLKNDEIMDCREWSEDGKASA